MAPSSEESSSDEHGEKNERVTAAVADDSADASCRNDPGAAAMLLNIVDCTERCGREATRESLPNDENEEEVGGCSGGRGSVLVIEANVVPLSVVLVEVILGVMEVDAKESVV